MNNKTFLAIAFLLAGTLLTTATTAMVPAYAGGDDDDHDKRGDGNKQRVQEEGAGAIADCDWNDIEESDFRCIAAAATDESIIRDREPTEPEPEPEPETCQECFERFIPEEIGALEAVLDVANQAESLEQFCEEVLEPGFIREAEVRAFLTSAGVDEDTQDALIQCLEDVGITFEPDME